MYTMAHNMGIQWASTGYRSFLTANLENKANEGRKDTIQCWLSNASLQMPSLWSLSDSESA